ncbi:hypothetical protein [Candidatus Ruminimicrobium bovinum]|uniref:hypothetical protein n=1 Tax=Candidatus Ruminimicrobium bovinum TaxID=3242779 RepID=UPI0039B8999D
MDGIGRFILYFMIALVMSAVCWFVCFHYTKLWNKRFHVSPSFHIVCCVAAVITFVATMAFIGLKNTKPVAESIVQAWSEDLMDDDKLQSECFRQSYYSIKGAGLERIDEYKTPEEGGKLIPMAHSETYELVGGIYANGACQDFNDRFPFLGYFLHADAGVPAEVIAADVTSFFASSHERLYQLDRGMKLAIQYISNDLQAQAGRIVRITRMWLILLFLLVQFIPFGIIGYLAYKDLHFSRHEHFTDDDSFDDSSFVTYASAEDDFSSH